MAGTRARTKSKPKQEPKPAKTPPVIDPIEVEKASIILGVASDPKRVSVLVALAQNRGEVETDELAKLADPDPASLTRSLAQLQLADLTSARRIRNKIAHSLTVKGWALARFLDHVVLPAATQREPDVEIDPKLLSDVGEVMDDPEQWFHTPNSVFEGRKPLELLGTPDEPRLRNRIEAARQGMFS